MKSKRVSGHVNIHRGLIVTLCLIMEFDIGQCDAIFCVNVPSLHMDAANKIWNFLQVNDRLIKVSMSARRGYKKKCTLIIRYLNLTVRKTRLDTLNMLICGASFFSIFILEWKYLKIFCQLKHWIQHYAGIINTS